MIDPEFVFPISHSQAAMPADCRWELRWADGRYEADVRWPETAEMAEQLMAWKPSDPAPKIVWCIAQAHDIWAGHALEQALGLAVALRQASGRHSSVQPIRIAA